MNHLIINIAIFDIAIPDDVKNNCGAFSAIYLVLELLVLRAAKLWGFGMPVQELLKHR